MRVTKTTETLFCDLCGRKVDNLVKIERGVLSVLSFEVQNTDGKFEKFDDFCEECNRALCEVVIRRKNI